MWVAAAPEPVLVRMANIQHLATPIRAQLAEPIGAVELAGLLHPDARPWAASRARAPSTLIPALEGLDRGWYAGPGGLDGRGRATASSAWPCAAPCCAGRSRAATPASGVVRDSDPAAELAETEVKLEALLPVLAG